nr:transposase, MuDR [Tanacetum cinerariifolium]
CFSNYFYLKINHGGAFTSPPKIRYKGGKVNWVDTIDFDVFFVVEVNTMMREIGNNDDVIEDVSEDEWLQNCLRKVAIKKKHAAKNDNDRGQSSRNEGMNVEYDRADGSHRDHGSGNQNASERDDASNREDGFNSYDDIDSQDSDFLVDPDNMIDDVDVDIVEFRSNIDANVE